MMQFAWNVQQSNHLVTQFTIVENSMGMNPNANTFLQVLLSLGRENRDKIITNAQFILREIQDKYPGSFVQN